MVPLRLILFRFGIDNDLNLSVTQANGSISMVDSNGYLLPDFVQAAKENVRASFLGTYRR